MSEFIFNYGLFVFKTITIVILVIIGLAFFISIVTSRSREKESLEIEKINDYFDSLQDAIESEVLPKAEYKKISKERKKNDKKCKKSKKNKSKSEKTQKRLFVLKFEGDLHATEVDNLRESISALLTVAKPEDEILLMLESCGGMVHNYGLAASQLARIKEKNINLVVSVDLVAASGGYMMACIANKIIAAPFAVLGSIGVLAQVPNFNRLLSKLNVDIEHHTAGKYKSTLTMLGKNTPEAREKFKEELEDTHKLFKSFVNDHRPKVNIEELATGEHWYGITALNLKLIDEIKTSDDYLLEKAKDTDIYQVTYRINMSIKEKIDTMLYDTLSNLVEKCFSKARSIWNCVG